MQRTVLRGVFQKIKKINYAASLPGTEIPHQHWCYHYPFSNPCLCFLFRRILTSLHHSIFPAWLPGYPSFYRTWCNKTSDTVLHFLLLSTDSLNQLFVQVLCTKIPRKGNVLGNICNQGLNNDFPTFHLSTKVYLTRCLQKKSQFLRYLMSAGDFLKKILYVDQIRVFLPQPLIQSKYSWASMPGWRI